MALKQLENTIEETAIELLRRAVTRLPDDVKRALKSASERETSDTGRKQLNAILSNIDLAESRSLPMCQDTGIPNFYVKVGEEFPVLAGLGRMLRNAVARATPLIPLRPNAVDPLTGRNSGDNTGKHIPYLNWEVVPGNALEITTLPKGGGSENMCVLKMMSPSEGITGVQKFVVDSVVLAGGKPCPPTILGLGIGGGADIAMRLAKGALLRPIGSHNSDAEVARLEAELLDLVNETGVGPMGLGGAVTSLAVNVEIAHRHPASFPVALAVQCWAARRAAARIEPGGNVEYLTHRLE